MSKFSLKNKVALVTGDVSGIGKTILLTLAQLEATIYIFDFNLETAKKMVLCLNDGRFVTLNGN